MPFLIVFLFVTFIGKRSFTAVLESNSFIEAHHSHYFIDKTFLIEKAFGNEGPLIMVAPEGFGKTTNLDMMKVFFSNRVDYKQAQDIFRSTQIARDYNFIKTHLGSHPVLHCSFVPSSYVTDYESMLMAFRTTLHEVFLEHEYLINSSGLTIKILENIKKYVDGEKYKHLELSEITSGLFLLSQVLRAHYKKQVILLIDDYDSVILDSVFIKSLEISDAVSFYNAVLSKVLNNNINVNKSILTGTSCTFSNLLSGISNISCVKFLQEKKFEPYFGLTVDEVDDLVGRTVFTDNRNDLKTWYNGYTNPDRSAHIYNTKSVLGFFKSSGKLECHWNNTKVQNAFRVLLDDRVTKSMLSESAHKIIIVIRQLGSVDEALLEGLKKMIVQQMWDEDCSDIYIHLLMEEGYFTFETPWERSGYNSSITVKFPNLEVSEIVKRLVLTITQELKSQRTNLIIA